ncbi:type I restriction endonuclease [Pleurocapsa sp. FMAR1]|uniref:type I restriction endonuclease n=1 Tax=Pleurocapsa sp. FMAR1 TaxID=3040204 RepID=UPI0029C63D04|nr:type I restriction endonuclease [Pleurocapsa sp. FMAR1]
MDFTDRVKAFAATIPQKLDGIKTEAATQQFLVMLFIQNILGYDVFDPNEVIPEYDANVGASTNYKLDYAIFQNGQPLILIECKCYGSDLGNYREYNQLFAYFMATEARIGILTNGVIYKFYTDLERPNKMDKTPFLELNLLKLNESTLKKLSNLTKSTFNLKDAISSASELKYVGGIKALLRKQMKSPDEDFLKYFFRELCPENDFSGQLKEDFFGYTLRGIKEFITEEMKHLLDNAVNPPEPKLETEEEAQELEEKEKNTEFTEDEREGYYIIRAILSSLVLPSRITYRDTASYCNILLDNNGRRQIARFYFNNPEKKKLEIFSLNDDGSKESETFAINNLNEIHEYADQYKKIVMYYEQPKVV